MIEFARRFKTLWTDRQALDAGRQNLADRLTMEAAAGINNHPKFATWPDGI